MWIYRNVFRRFIEIEGLRDKFSLFYWIKLYLIDLIKSGYCLWEEAITTRFTPVVWRMVRVSTASMNDLICIILMTYIRHSKSKTGFSRFKLHKNCQQINFCWQEKFIFFQLSTWREAVHHFTTAPFSLLFIRIICINYRLNLFHQSIIVILVINSTEHRITHNITISVN